MNGFRSKLVRTLSPALSAAMLLWAAHLTQAWPSRGDAAAFRERSRQAVDAIPLRVGGLIGRNIEPQVAAIEMGRPNVERSIEYRDAQLGPGAGGLRRPVWLNVVQCRRATDLLGHDPARYYPAAGETPLGSRPRTWVVGSRDGSKPFAISGTEYRFGRQLDGQSVVRIVYNFMVAPGRGLTRDLKELEEAAEDRQRRYLGATQVQVVFASLTGEEQAEEDRDELFASLMRAGWPAISALRSGE